LYWRKCGIPLSIDASHKQRSWVSLGNWLEVILICLTYPAAVHPNFMVSDGEDVSLSELLRRMDLAMVYPARLLPVPSSWLKRAAGSVG
jgi:hypothetical protein